uniref:Uncharacterized protein n=1 Tax=Candidatus Kentrum sp. DK TaxID=2126562 RepID=A0A450SA26_9GAMM|nr:MAG: hypothetical protein BECKDK2373B_GA0170837_102137 [Candidatus Kentron sp. DK]
MIPRRHGRNFVRAAAASFPAADLVGRELAAVAGFLPGEPDAVFVLFHDHQIPRATGRGQRRLFPGGAPADDFELGIVEGHRLPRITEIGLHFVGKVLLGRLLFIVRLNGLDLGVNGGGALFREGGQCRIQESARLRKIVSSKKSSPHLILTNRGRSTARRRMEKNPHPTAPWPWRASH